MPTGRSASSPARVWIVEDDSAFVESLRPLFRREEGFHLVYAAADGRALDALSQNGEEPDVVLVDYRLPGASGVEVLARLRARYPSAGLVMLTSDDRSATIVAALSAGASGYVLKGAPFEEVMGVLREVLRGGMLMSPAVARHVQDHFTSTPRNEAGLSDRELDVLRAMAEGLAQKEIASALDVSQHTVDSHLRNIYRKLHVRSGTAAVARAVRSGLV